MTCLAGSWKRDVRTQRVRHVPHPVVVSAGGLVGFGRKKVVAGGHDGASGGALAIRTCQQSKRFQKRTEGEEGSARSAVRNRVGDATEPHRGVVSAAWGGWDGIETKDQGGSDQNQSDSRTTLTGAGAGEGSRRT